MKSFARMFSKKYLNSLGNGRVLIGLMVLVLSALLSFCSVFGYNSYNDMQRASSFHGILWDIDDKTISLLKSDSDVNKVGEFCEIGVAEFQTAELTIMYYDQEMMDLANYTLISGVYPKESKQILLDKEYRREIVPDVNPGDYITVSNIDSSSGAIADTERFLVCGLFESESSFGQDDRFYTALVSSQYKNSKSNMTDIAVRLNSSDNNSIKSEFFALIDKYKINTDKMQLNPVFADQNASESNLVPVIICAVSVFPILFTTVLYSTLYISRIRRVRIYGQLITIGAKKRHIKMLDRREARYYMRYLGAGLLLGCAVAWLLFPSFIFAFANLLIVLVCMVLLSLITRFVQSRVGRSINVLSPVEAMRHQFEKQKKTRRLSREKPLKSLALLCFRMNRRKSAHTVFSLTLIGVIFFSAVTVFASVNSDHRLINLFPNGGDYKLTLNESVLSEEKSLVSLQRDSPFTEKLVDMLRDDIGVAEMNFGYYAEVMIDTDLPELEGIVLDLQGYPLNEQGSPENTEGVIINKGSSLFSSLSEIFLNENLPLKIFGEDQVYSLPIAVTAEVKGTDALLLLRDDLFEEYFRLNAIESIEIGAKSADVDRVGQKLYDLVASNNHISLQDYDVISMDFENAYSTIAKGFYIIFGIIVLVCFVNLSNITLTSVYERSIDYRLLWNIGLSIKEISALIKREIMLYSKICIPSILVFGNIGGYALCEYFRYAGMEYISYKAPIFSSLIAGCSIYVVFLSLANYGVNFFLNRNRELEKVMITEGT